MVAEIISVGTELLLGQVTDTNASFLSRRLADLGIDLYRRTTVGDNVQRIGQVIQEALSRSDLALMTGGLGPTPDDVTAEGVAVAFGVRLVFHPQAEEWLLQRLSSRGIRPSPTLLKQALLPEGAIPIPNPIGTAPGIWMEKDGKRVIVLPGVPSEMEAMFDDEVTPRLKDLLKGDVLRVRVLRFSGVGESALTDRLADIMGGSNPTVGTLVKPGEVWLRLACKAPSETDAEAALNELHKKIVERVGQWLVGVGEDPLEVLVMEALKGKGWTIATAESVTGGLIGARLTFVPGASQHYRGGIIAYTEGVKMSLLSVPWSVIAEKGVVSEECARHMAGFVRTRLRADVGVSTTGYAGPTGGEEDKPIGTVFIGLVTPNETKVERYQLRGNRQQIRDAAAQLALAVTLRSLKVGAAGK
ncbi:MAG: competence/damage-inducible protein A [Armatimonadetes bacterium]|nr:competence/damage-inducible protein A [Armatimonadota bacterium]MDW8120861.1 competence/damage-inducible protein A [Armatimonadota bacterium]